MASVMYLGGRKALTPEEVEQRRQGLLDALARKKGELAEAQEQVTALAAQVHRLEGGIIESDWTLEQMTPQPEKPVEEEP